jgi:hypothetical protein
MSLRIMGVFDPGIAVLLELIFLGIILLVMSGFLTCRAADWPSVRVFSSSISYFVESDHVRIPQSDQPYSWVSCTPARAAFAART